MRVQRPFFKYATPETALAILKNRTVRYSSPLCFNDPFDIQSGLQFDFNIDFLKGKILDRLFKLATEPTEPIVDAKDPWGEMVLLIRNKYSTHGFPRSRMEALFEEPFAELVEVMKTTQQSYQEHWWKKLLPGIRVFCVSEERDNLLMWSHYAKDHSGAVLEFLSLPEEDNPLSVAQPVQYVAQPPTFLTEDEWIEGILSVRKFEFNHLYRRYAYYKSQYWGYEKEWRVWFPNIPASEALYEDMPIRQSEFASLYFGCKATESFVQEAISLVRVAFPNVKIFRARKSQYMYALEYTEIEV